MPTKAGNLDFDRAEVIWAQYQQTHDLSGQKGRTAAIKLETGEVFFGESMLDIVHRRRELGDQSRYCFFRVGYSTYYKKRRREGDPVAYRRSASLPAAFAPGNPSDMLSLDQV